MSSFNKLKTLNYESPEAIVDAMLLPIDVVVDEEYYRTANVELSANNAERAFPRRGRKIRQNFSRICEFSSFEEQVAFREGLFDQSHQAHCLRGPYPIQFPFWKKVCVKETFLSVFCIQKFSFFFVFCLLFFCFVLFRFLFRFFFLIASYFFFRGCCFWCLICCCFRTAYPVSTIMTLFADCSRRRGAA